jgi:hypothetical protein
MNCRSSWTDWVGYETGGGSDRVFSAKDLNVLLIRWESGAIHEVVVAKVEPGAKVCVVAWKNIGFAGD